MISRPWAASCKAAATLPNLFIVGAVKCGTTSLYAYLRQHPQIFFPEMKEPHFYTRPQPAPEQAHLIQYVADADDYAKLYAHAGGYPWRGDASPSYLWSAQAAQRIRADVPQARILILLRDPVQRAYSQYLMDFREGVVNDDFYTILLRDWQRPDKGWGVSQLYVELGQYLDQVRRYRELFGPEQVRVYLLEELKRDARAVLLDIADFLGIDPAPIDGIDLHLAHNAHRQPRGEWARRLAASPWSRYIGEHLFPQRWGEYLWQHVFLRAGEKPPMDPRARAFLQRLYEPEIRGLEKLLGRPLPELRLSWQREERAAEPRQESMEGLELPDRS
ncbi:sulfotransferase family protein [Acidithiobacillus caldus]|jgi:hypothetical protein|uniref:Sulfotransferase n=1 Tax=Acidithiobacillus caldus (strain ATCC 51756 / DSM 8584 / KU) TaxID=637389 RepID=A0A059ZTL5_ACICK|nr:sulfotransferase [Acidithiobacillus caldus]AIA54965.1 Sulfotransferase [Acidithiobacillus caldus ATCC 51756]MBU2730938.1 sulfotransferase domain-containing protein [Acidithiobacillus caldus]MBU2734545.1 sulfotransferase domain-containing protein [Acidithiobacillus caldus ATCC 51756]MBU2746223.1 sulfotransferase domain-containing protein [Acidithiobacillus caldus]MBU2781144.1 sulfotransferase domain-containing protein [Acidithiobacillus caldus]